MFVPFLFTCLKQVLGVRLLYSVSNRQKSFLRYLAATRWTSDGSDGCTCKTSDTVHSPFLCCVLNSMLILGGDDLISDGATCAS